MRRRILKMMIATVVVMGLLLGVPLTLVTWRWITQEAHQTLAQNLKRMSEFVLAEEAAGRPVPPSRLDIGEFRLLIPANGRLTLTARVPDGSGGQRRIERHIGPDHLGPTIAETVSLGANAQLQLEIPKEQIRPRQFLAVGVLATVIAGSVLGGAVVAVVTARRLGDPLTDVAGRAAAMARGDFSAEWPTYGIDELDRVSTALADANREIALRLEREGEIVGDVSHQLRSRLTAVHLRLDELTLHDDPAVVAEAEAGLEQVERLSRELDELVAASRGDSTGRGAIAAEMVVDTLIGDFHPAFEAQGRELVAEATDGVPLVSGRPGRLREALSVLIDNALQHGDGTVTVRVSDLRAAEMVRVTVADEGAGVSDEIAVDVFRRGFSAGSRSGFGLSLARALIEADGGRLDLTSRRPAVFAIVLPALGRMPARAGGAAGDDVKRGRVPHR